MYSINLTIQFFLVLDKLKKYYDLKENLICSMFYKFECSFFIQVNQIKFISSNKFNTLFKICILYVFY